MHSSMQHSFLKLEAKKLERKKSVHHKQKWNDFVIIMCTIAGNAFNFLEKNELKYNVHIYTFEYYLHFLSILFQNSDTSMLWWNFKVSLQNIKFWDFQRIFMLTWLIYVVC